MDGLGQVGSDTVSQERQAADSLTGTGTGTGSLRMDRDRSVAGQFHRNSGKYFTGRHAAGSLTGTRTLWMDRERTVPG